MTTAERYHLYVPKEPAANVLFRRRLLRRCRNEPKFRRAVLEMCRRDIVFFTDVFVWQFNPNAIGEGSFENGPFITWDLQEELVEEILYCIQERRDLVIEKSREMGASWLCLIVMVWFTLFHRYKKFLCVSKDADAVDSADADSLFWKIDFILEHLPDWLKPKISRVKFRISNKGYKSAITGVASTGDIGVGGRATAVFVDEFSLIKKDFQVLHHTANTTGCRIFNGTHRGTGTALAKITDPESPTAAFIRKFKMHWSRHPDKVAGAYHYDSETQAVVPHDPLYEYPADFAFDTSGKPAGGPFPGLRSPWYDFMCGRMDSGRAVAMDLDIDVSGSVEQLFPPLLIKTLISKYAQEPDWVGDLLVDDDGRTLRFSERAQGPLKLWTRLDRESRPQPAPYVFGVDPSHGTGATPSCVSGLNGRTGEKVFQYVNPHIEPTPLAHLIVAVCNWFKDQDNAGAHLIWEIQGPGATFGKRVIESGYRRVYYRTDESKVRIKVSENPGWNSEAKSKDNLLVGYRDGLRGGREGRFLNRSKEALADCANFNFTASGHVEHSGEASPDNNSGARINHGDLVIADALAWKFCVELKRLVGLSPDGKVEEIKSGTLAWRRLFVQNESSRRPWAT